MLIRFACLLVFAFSVTACGRMGEPLVPEQGTIIMKPDQPSAKPALDRRFILDPLL